MTTVRKTLSELKPLSKEREAELKALKDEDIDYSDIPELDESFWDNAVLHQPKNKKRISIRIDDDIVEFFKNNGEGKYQTKMNAVLRSYVRSVKNGSFSATKKKLGKFEIYKDKAGEFRFRLKNSEGQNLILSEGYKAKKSCVNGIKAIKKNAPFGKHFKKNKSEGGKFSFSVKAGNNQVIGTSSTYETAEARDSGIDSVKDSASEARIDDDAA